MTHRPINLLQPTTRCSVVFPAEWWWYHNLNMLAPSKNALTSQIGGSKWRIIPLASLRGGSRL